MSGFTDAEDGLEEDMLEDVSSGVSKNIHANTMFTPVKDPYANSPGLRSNTTSPGSGSRPNSALRRSAGPSDELLRPTAARIHDELQLRDKAESKKKKPLRVAELTNDRLLRPTKAQESNMKTLEEHKAKLKSPGASFKIAPEDYVVSERLMKMNSTRRHDFEAVQELKNRPTSPPSPKIDPNYVPSDRLLKTTVVRQLELAIVNEKKHEKEERENPTVVAKSNTPKKEYKPNEHLLKPTQSSLLASKEWEKQKEANKYADDIFWELRKPAERARSRASTPSKLTNPTKAFISGTRDKAIVNTAPETPESAAAEYRPSVMPTTPIDQESRLLKTTKAVKLSSWHADNSEYICEEAKIVTHLEMSTKDSYLYRNARPKFMAETASARAYKALSSANFPLLKQQEQASSPPKNRPGSPVRPLSERLLASNKSMLAKHRDRFVKTVDPVTVREESWKVSTKKGVIPEVPTSPTTNLHVVRPTSNHLLKEVPSEGNLTSDTVSTSSPRAATGVKRVSLGGGGSVNGGRVVSTPNTPVNSKNNAAAVTTSGKKSSNGVAAHAPGRSPNAPAPSYPGVELPEPPVAIAIAAPAVAVVPPPAPVPAAVEPEAKPAAAVEGGAKIIKPVTSAHTPTHHAPPAAALVKATAHEHNVVEDKEKVAVEQIVEDQLVAPVAALTINDSIAAVSAPVVASEPVSVPAAVHHEEHRDSHHHPTSVKGGGKVVKPAGGNGHHDAAHHAPAHDTHSHHTATHAHAPTLHKAEAADTHHQTSEVHDEFIAPAVAVVEATKAEAIPAAAAAIEEKTVAATALVKKDSKYDAMMVEEEGEDEEEMAAAAAVGGPDQLTRGNSKKKNKKNKNKK